MTELTKRQMAALKPIPTTLFSFHKEDGTFTAEISDLNGYIFNSLVKLRNPKTGNEVAFDLVAVDRDAEGDVLAWRFKSRSTAHPNLGITVFND